MILFKWNKHEGYLKHVANYANGQPCIRFHVAGEPFPIATVTVNVPDADVPEGHILVRGWSNNAGIPAALAAQGIAERISTAPTGYEEATLMKLLHSIEDFKL